MLIFCNLLLISRGLINNKTEESGSEQEALLKNKSFNKTLVAADKLLLGTIIIVLCIFNLMIVMTCLYFHTFLEKILGAVLGVVSFRSLSCILSCIYIIKQ